MVTRIRDGTTSPTQRLNLHVSFVSPLLKSYRDAFNDPNWQNAMCDGDNALIKNKTWTLVPRSPDTNIVRCMWLFRHKYLADGTLSRYKARLVANSSTQLEGIDVDETFGPVVKSGTIRTILSLDASRHLSIHQLHVKNAFLHGDLSETVYMYQPFGFQDSAHPDYVCLLQRSLYGLKQAPELGFSGFMDSSHSSARSSVSHNSVSCDVVVERSVPSGTILNAFTEEIVPYENDSNETHAVKKLNALCTLESFVTHSSFDTPSGTIYYIPKVSTDVLLVKGNVYDSVDDYVVAYMKYATEAGKFVLNVFDTIHNHELGRKEYKHLSKTERQLMYMEQAFIMKVASVNIGATRARHLLTGNSDAQMLIHKMENRKKHVFDFLFDYLVENVELTAIFRPMKFLSTIIGSLAMLYRLMLPLRQTTIDNHKKCVTVAAGLLKNETTKSYIWLLKAFMKAFGKAPSIVVTDQDGAMRNAIEAEFGGSKHRLCMWHITQKLPAKICAKIYDETDFKEKLNKIVWNMYIGPEEFEYRWGKLMEEFKLENHKWLTKMFNIRSTWIPAYFIDSPLCGLMRTTSRSESENSFFSHFTNSGSTLMNFMNCFETAMEKQRHVQERMDHKTIDIVPKLKTLLKIEHHASNVYTRSLFELVQKEIFVGLFYCQIDSKCLVEGSENANVEMIPQQYILRHRMKNLIHAALRNKRNRYGEKNVVVENYVDEATSFVDHCVQLLSKDESRLGAFIEKLKSLKKEVEADCPNPPSKNKTDNLEQLVGVSKPPVVDVNNPTVGSTKGRKKLHIKGGKEKAIEKSLKGRNSCLLCGGTDHNKRTCPQRFEGQDEVVVQKEVGQEEVLVQKDVCQEEVVVKKEVRQEEFVQENVDLSEDEEELSEEDEDLIHE
ncbi:FAR1-related sequence 5-like protein [Tanacetum coccineum]